MIVRAKLTPLDLGTAFYLSKEFYAEYRKNHPDDCPMEDDNMLRNVLAGYLTDADKVMYFYLHNTDVVGMFAGHITNFICSPGFYAEDRVMYISPSARNGIPLARLLKQFEQWAKENGCRSVKLSALASKNNDALAKICERKGYRRTQITLSKLI